MTKTRFRSSYVYCNRTNNINRNTPQTTDLWQRKNTDYETFDFTYYYMPHYDKESTHRN